MSIVVPELERLCSACKPVDIGSEAAARSVADGLARFRLVLLGEATHGTAEFYRFRAAITRQLIERHGFRAVAAEADWPDALRVHRYVMDRDRDRGRDGDAGAALDGFHRFPAWMWRNEEVRDFVEWLREWNRHAAPARRCGFYGIDLYSLNTSISAVLEYLDRVDPDAALQARERYSCFDRFGRDPHWYGVAATMGGLRPCEEPVIRELREIQRLAQRWIEKDGPHAPDEQFYAEQNALVVANAEAYYRIMCLGTAASWNLRDEHMTSTILRLLRHLDLHQGGGSRCVVWAHNSHLGDARATEMGGRGERNVGQMLRERTPGTTVNVGFTTHSGTVTAADEWGGPAATIAVRPALAESYEDLFHRLGIPAFAMNLSADPAVAGILEEPRLERAIGVIYRPDTERRSHYFRARLPRQFDWLVHIERTAAVRPLERASVADAEYPETYPSGQ